MDSQSLTPKVIKEELDRYVIGQDDAKKAIPVSILFTPEPSRLIFIDIFVSFVSLLNVNSRICNQLFSTYIYRNNG